MGNVHRRDHPDSPFLHGVSQPVKHRPAIACSATPDPGRRSRRIRAGIGSAANGERRRTVRCPVSVAPVIRAVESSLRRITEPVHGTLMASEIETPADAQRHKAERQEEDDEHREVEQEKDSRKREKARRVRTTRRVSLHHIRAR